jgi:hypothetical protein
MLLATALREYLQTGKLGLQKIRLLEEEQWP